MTYQVPDQRGKRAIVTGANSGTGKEAARKLAGAGASVILAVRTVAKGEQAMREIRAQHPHADVEVRRVDLADLASVREFADSVLADGQPVDLLLNNAGVMAPPVRHETADGFELQLGSNVLGPFALTLRLLPALLTAPAPRVVTMSSGTASMGRIDFDDLNWEKSYGGWSRGTPPRPGPIRCCMPPPRATSSRAATTARGGEWSVSRLRRNTRAEPRTMPSPNACGPRLSD